MLDEQGQTTPAEVDKLRKWVTVEEAFLACQEAGLDRTKKTIRSWCRQEHVEGRKQTTPTGERWMLEDASLQVKIRNELEFQRQNEPVQTGANPSEPVRTEDIPVRTSAHPFEQVHTSANASEPVRESNAKDKSRIEELESQVRSLEIDKEVRDRHVGFLSKQNEEGQRQLLSQSRYIGHLETKVLQLGEAPDQSFLEAPVPPRPKTAEPADGEARPAPNQAPLDIHTHTGGQR